MIVIVSTSLVKYNWKQTNFSPGVTLHGLLIFVILINAKTKISPGLMLSLLSGIRANVRVIYLNSAI